MMHIRVTLGPDRAKPGELVLEDEKGMRLMQAPCLGKADGGKAVAMGNRKRDPTRQFGDVPCGRYGPIRVNWPYDKHDTLGEAWIPLPLETATGAQAEAARANGRYDLHIHAGRGSGRLVPTYGCLRLKAGDFYRLCSTISVGAGEVTVTIEETVE